MSFCLPPKHCNTNKTNISLPPRIYPKSHELIFGDSRVKNPSPKIKKKKRIILSSQSNKNTNTIAEVFISQALPPLDGRRVARTFFFHLASRRSSVELDNGSRHDVSCIPGSLCVPADTTAQLGLPDACWPTAGRWPGAIHSCMRIHLLDSFLGQCL